MSNLSKLKRAPATITIEGDEIQVHALRLGDIASLLSKHPRVALAFQAKGPDRGLAIVRAVLEAGATAVCEVIDAGTRNKPGTAASADLDPLDEADILLSVFERTLPSDEERLEKFKARLTDLMTRLGGPVAETDRDSSGQSSPTSS